MLQEVGVELNTPCFCHAWPTCCMLQNQAGCSHWNWFQTGWPESVYQNWFRRSARVHTANLELILVAHVRAHVVNNWDNGAVHGGVCATVGEDDAFTLFPRPSKLPPSFRHFTLEPNRFQLTSWGELGLNRLAQNRFQCEHAKSVSNQFGIGLACPCEHPK